MSSLPASVLQIAIRAAVSRLVKPKPTRNPAERRRYARDPWAYFVEILGFQLTLQQEEVLQAVMDHDRVAIQSANNLGKTFLMGGIGAWFMDAVGEQADARGFPEGARLLLPGPDLSTVRQTIWAEMCSHIERARSLGHDFVGKFREGPNQKDLWTIAHGWVAEALSPPRRSGQKQAHGAAGRHKKWMMALVEEAAGLDDPVWASLDGMCSGHGNKIVAAFNPYDQRGKAYEIARSPTWKVVVLSTLDHPNIQKRRAVIPGAIAHQALERDIKDSCEDRGPASKVFPSPEHQEFCYALPPDLCEDDEQPREDGLGHALGELRVYRPLGTFAPRRLGLFPKEGASGLFSGSAWDQAVKRWLEKEDPNDVPPDRVGFDATGGKDEAVAVPSWGQDVEWLLREWTTASVEGNQERIRDLQENHRLRIGRPNLLQTDGRSGPDMASQLVALYPASHILSEFVSDGKSVIDHLRDVIGHTKTTGINLQSPIPPSDYLGEDYWGNERAAMFGRFALAVNRGLVDLPPDSKMREDAMAMAMEHKGAKAFDGEYRRIAYALEKRKLRKILGRSSDRFDAAVISGVTPDVQETSGSWIG